MHSNRKIGFEGVVAAPESVGSKESRVPKQRRLPDKRHSILGSHVYNALTIYGEKLSIVFVQTYVQQDKSLKDWLRKEVIIPVEKL